MSSLESGRGLARYSIRVTATFERDFGRLDNQLIARLDSVIRSLEANPYAGKRLRGELTGKWSLRIGDYRIIYTVSEAERTVVLYTVKHRRKVYK